MKHISNISKRIFSLILVLCFAILPLGSAFSIISNAQNSVDESYLELNGATVLTETNKYLKTSSYVTTLDNGFDLSKDYASSIPLTDDKGNPTKFVSFYIDTLGEGGSVLKGRDQKNGYDAYGFIAGSGEEIYDTDEDGKETLVGKSSIAIKLKYNYNKTTNIMGIDGKKWDISDDSWKSTINGMASVGVVGMGAVIVQKYVPTEDQPYPVSSSDWKRLNEFSGKETDGLHTVNFFKEYSPKNHQDPFNIYVPSGDDLQKGVYVKLTVAYEIVNTRETGWWIFSGEEKTYKNIVEETVFYLCNTSNEIVFTNLYYETDDSTEDDAEGKANETGVESKGGAISNNQGARDGFRVDMNGWNYDVTYHFNDSTNALPCEDGQVFLDTGKYEFVIKSGINVIRRKTVYIHEKTIDKNLEVYFGSGLASSDSVRVFAPSETYPVYVKDTVTLNARNDNGGLIKHAPLVGKVYYLGYEDWNDTEKVERDENGLPKNGFFAEKTASQENWSITGLEPGNYEAVFFNNEEYFSGAATGDTYKFVWRFTVVEEGLGPMVNNELLYEQIGFSDFKAEHYVAALSTKGEGRLLCVFSDYQGAYDFACKFLASTVIQNEGTYTFDSITYDTEEEMLVSLREKAKSIVEKRYFDATDINTFITISEDIIIPIIDENSSEEDIEYYNSFVKAIDREFSRDVLVFTSSDTRYELAAGLPFLNDRINAYLDENGLVKVEYAPVYFIHVADFESSSIIIKLQGSDISYPIPYGVPVQSYLEEHGAPSGIYTIVESNGYATTEYEAVYISPGDIQTEITIERIYNNSLITQVIDKRDNGTRLRANNFKITDIFNELDEYGILRINKNGEEILLCQIDDLDSIPVIDEEGSYEIVTIDRLGNQFSFFVDIYTSKKIYTFSLTDNDNVVFTENAFGGKEFTLPTLEPSSENLEFVGWKDENGVIHNGTYVFNSPQNIDLEAVYHYTSVEINVYDGNIVDTITGNVGVTSALPEISREGYVLYGYRYLLEDGTIRFYREQITSVPNVESMRLDAIWIKVEDTEGSYISGRGENIEISLVDGSIYHQITIQKDGKTELPVLQNQAHLDFVGWIYQYKLSGMIFTDELIYSDVLKIGVSDENSVILTSAWISKESTSEGEAEPPAESTTDSKTNNIMLPAGVTSTGGGFFNGTNSGTGGSTFFNSTSGFSFGISLLVAAFAFLMLALKGKIKGLVSVISQKIKSTEYIGDQSTSYDEEISEGYTIGIGARRRLSKILVSALCIFLCVITLVGPQTALLSYAADSINEAVYEHNEEKAQEEAIEQEVNLINDTLSRVEESFDEQNLTRIQEFLYSNVMIDLYSIGYTEIFPAYAIVGENTPNDTSDDKEIYGIGYTAYVDAYDENGEIYFGAGFVSFPENGVITTEDKENGVIVRVSEDVADDFVYTSFKLTANQTIYPSHYVAYEHYTYYQVLDYVIQSTTVEDDGTYLDIYGDVFDYDIGEYCHFVNYGIDFDYDLYKIFENTDYNLVSQTYLEAIRTQYANGIDVTIEKADYISMQAINDFVAHNQDESFLGLDSDTLLYYEANISDTQYYVVCEDGSVMVLELPPDPQRQASIWERIAIGVASLGAVALGVVVAVAFPGNPLAGALSGALIAVAVDLFVQVVVTGTAIENVDTTSLMVSAITGAVSGAIGTGIGAGVQAIKNSAMKVGLKIALAIGTAAVGGAVSGSVSYLANSIARGEDITFGDCMKSAGLGAIVSVVALGVSCAANAVAGIESASTAAFIACQAAAGAIVGFANYFAAMLILGQEFSWSSMLLSVGISTTLATAFAIGTKVVYNNQTAKASREQNNSKTKANADDKSDDYKEIKKMIESDDGLEEFMENHPEKASEWKKTIEKYKELANSDDPDVTPAQVEKAAKAVKVMKGKILEEATKDMLANKGFTVESTQHIVQGKDGLTYPDIVAVNNTNEPIKLFNQTINPGETIMMECKAGSAGYIRSELKNHIPNQLSGHGNARSYLLTTSDSDNVDIGYLKVLSETNTTHARLDISADQINDVLLNYGGK